MDTGQRPEFLSKLAKECHGLRRLRVFQAGELDSQRKNIPGRESRIDTVERDDAADEQTGANQENERHRELGHGKNRPDTAAGGAVTARSRPPL